jgi:hypothetical protein
VQPVQSSGVYPVVDDNHMAGVDPDFAVEPTGVDIEDAFDAYVTLGRAEPEDGLRHQDPS